MYSISRREQRVAEKRLAKDQTKHFETINSSIVKDKTKQELWRHWATFNAYIQNLSLSLPVLSLFYFCFLLLLVHKLIIDS